MYLKSITMRGFKSFPDRTRLEFGPATSVIVGPNGSGKSNVTDAVLWALGEQSPMAVRGHSMQDVIFGGAPGRQAAGSATVELVLDDSEGTLGLGPEVSILRRLDRSGEGEYRIGGARCRLVDVIEVLSDTGLGKEMHSVISQGRVEAIVTSKARERRLLIEEAAGLGKHRKRRRRAQLKLGHTQDNLDRALDVEHEARSRLKPLKRQAEAAELHERLRRQTLEVRWELARDDLRDRRGRVVAAIERASEARGARAAIERELESIAARRRRAEEALAARSSRREELSRRSFGAQSAADRVGYRAESVRAGEQTVARRLDQARAQLERSLADAGGQGPNPEAQTRIESLSRELQALERDRAAELARQLAELERELEAVAALQGERAVVADAARGRREAAEAAHRDGREALRETERAVEAARRESARVGGELAAVNQFLRGHQGAPGGARSLADELQVAPGYELAVAAALDGRLGAALLDDRRAAGELLDRAGRDGGRTLVMRARWPASGAGADGVGAVASGAGADGVGAVASGAGADGVGAVASGAGADGVGAAPVHGAVRLAEHVSGDGAQAVTARHLLRGVWVVEDLSAVADDFAGMALTTGGRVYTGTTGELRQVAMVGEERVLAERNRRDELVGASERAVQSEHAARAEMDAAAGLAAQLDATREQAIAAHRAALDGLDEAVEQQRRLAAAIARRRSAPDEGPGADRRAQLQAELNAERSELERAEREHAQRQARILRLRAEIERDQAMAPRIAAVHLALQELVSAISESKQGFDAELERDREAEEGVAAELRSCGQEEAAIQSRLHAAGESLTAAAVASQRARDQQADAEQTLNALASELELEPSASQDALGDERREELRTRLERLTRRREQLGPVNPLAQDEYAEAVARVEELETQRADLETALRELEGLIKDTDRQIRETFEQTFEAAAQNFEELAARLFPGGSGRLRLVSERDARASDAADDDAGDGSAEDDLLGVEIEVTPAGKAMKRLTLLSGGEKSMTALAFLFAVFLARPCPFYILDEVEAALDDLNITHFLDLLETYGERAQFIVVTHQKRTMEAADSLYGVSMGGDGISKVVSRRLPAREAFA